MAVLVYAETQGNKIKKAALECVFYGKKVADAEGTDCVAVVLGSADGVGELGKYGADRVIQITDSSLDQFDSMVHTSVVGQIAKNIDAKTVVLAHSSTGKSLLGRLSANLSAGSVSGVIDVPNYDGGFSVKKSVFSGKAIAEYDVHTDRRVLSLSGNSFKPEEIGTGVDVESMDVEIPSATVHVIERI